MDDPHGAPQDATAVSANDPAPVRGKRFRALREREKSGQAIVEFALVSVVFLMTVFGTVDFGRAIFEYSQLQNSVRDGARYGKMNPADKSTIQGVVLNSSPDLGMTPGRVDVSCTGGCYPGCGDVTVSASFDFTPITARFLGLTKEDLPITMRSTTTVTTE